MEVTDLTKLNQMDSRDKLERENGGYSFYAYLFRMRYISRWGLMRNSYTENIQEHSHMVAVLAHALALISRKVFGNKDISPDACAAAALFCAACSSLPDGSKKPQLTADRVAVADQNGLRGFNVRFTLHHNSLEPLEIKKIAAKVGVNRTLMCSAEIEEDDTPVAPRRDVTLTRFFPANLARPVSLKTLSSPMLHAEGEVQLQVFFTGDDEDPFNPSATYKGMIENDSQQ